MKKILVIMLFVNIALFAEPKQDTGVVLLDENNIKEDKNTKKEDIKKNFKEKKLKDTDKLTKSTKEDKNKKEEIKLNLNEEEFVFNSKYCKFDSSLDKSLELGIQMGSPFGLDIRFWATDFLGLSSIVGITSDLNFYISADVTLSLIIGGRWSTPQWS